MKNIYLTILGLMSLCIGCDHFGTEDVIQFNNKLVENAPTAIVDNLRVDIYEVTIDEYCKYFPEMRDVLIHRIKKVNLDKTLWPPIGRYPALVYYEEALDYTNARGVRLPHTSEYKELAYAKGEYTIGNVNGGIGGIMCARVDVKPMKAGSGNRNGLGLFQLMGNASEWANDGKTFGLSWSTCVIRDKDLFPVHTQLGTSGFRCVKDIEK